MRRRCPKRIAPLACLPLFFRLEGRRVAVIGGTDAATWKAELLAASGAEVHVFAPDLDLSFKDLIGTDSVKGRILHHAKHWKENCFDDVCLIVADAIDDDEAMAIKKAAHAAGVPVNVIDNPAHCDFQFGSIVNRSPVVIGISTNGVAPILGQAIRRRIEALLPRGLERWAELAGRIRTRIMKSLSAGQERRLFWEMFSDRALSGEVSQTTDLEKFSSVLIANAKTSRPGRITLVGTGNGDADLLTLKALRALQSADTIFFDELVSDEILELARREAQRIPAETIHHRRDCSQVGVNNRILSEVQQGKHVVRLNSGSAFIEKESLRLLEQSGFAVTVVPVVLFEQEASKQTVRQTGSVDRFPDAEVLPVERGWWSDRRSSSKEQHRRRSGFA
ncbi:siroheme synthase [Roseibium sp. SCP14]|uniref:siroheme synthase family protein n=1 Tax=Roseibium sp. SCP14 TaxID=3141375 RepID=UPI00333CD9C0